jgi:NitT/TauT family transport system permease protein
VGLAIGGVIGIGAGILFALCRPIDHVMKISIESIRPIPSIALIPIGMMIAGAGFSLEISVVAYTAIWPTLILARAAVLAVEPQLLEVAKVLNLGFVATITKVVLPSILPRLFVAVRLAIGFALIVAVTTEIVANPIGLGYAMLNAQQSMQPSLMLAFLTWIGIIGWVLSQATSSAQQWLFGKWDSK